ncbi:MAG: hypothetical protein ACI9CB_001361 [Rhodothermales bacterium]|jgi:uncharacterized protein (TIGR02466 family)
MSVPAEKSANIMQAFVTPIGSFKIKKAKEINPGLKKEILRLEALHEGKVKSNIGGWHSNEDLLTWETPEIAELQKAIKSTTMQMIRETSGVKKFGAGLKMSAWANVNRKGTFNANHNHPGCQWSGVYYVQGGDYKSDPIPRSGSLQFYDPRGSINMVQQPGNTMFGATLRITPEDGLLLIFPSWLYHSVSPFSSDTTRISIAFNVQITSFKEKGESPKKTAKKKTSKTKN